MVEEGPRKTHPHTYTYIRVHVHVCQPPCVSPCVYVLSVGTAGSTWAGCAQRRRHRRHRHCGVAWCGRGDTRSRPTARHDTTRVHVFWTQLAMLVVCFVGGSSVTTLSASFSSLFCKTAHCASTQPLALGSSTQVASAAEKGKTKRKEKKETERVDREKQRNKKKPKEDEKREKSKGGGCARLCPLIRLA